jgi:hypothetical protein
VITQEEFEHNLLPNANPTMAIPSLTTLKDPQFPKKKMTQRTLFGRVAPPSPKTIQVPAGKDHFCGFTKVHFHMCIVKVKPNGNKKKSKTIKSKKKIGKPKHCAFPKVQDDCKESVHLTHSLYIQELRDLVKGSTKK